MPSPQPAAQPIGLRERRRAESHRAIARAALKLASERGLDGFTIDDIATAADVSRRTFFNHFASKEVAVAHVAKDAVTDLLALVHTGGDVVADARAVLEALLSPALIRPLRQLAELAAANPSLGPVLHQVGEDARIEACGVLVAPLSGDLPTVTSHAVVGTVMGVAIAVITGQIPLVEIDGDVRGALTTSAVVEETTAFLTRSLTAG